MRPIATRLAIFAGIPSHAAADAQRGLARAFSGTTVIVHAAAPARDLYAEKSVHSLVNRAFRFIVGQSEASKRAGVLLASPDPAPVDISLVYVPCKSQSVLLAAFEFFAWCEPVQIERRLLNERNLLWEELKTPFEEGLLRAKTRIGQIMTAVRRASVHPAQLPPRNFLLDDSGVSLADVFRKILNQLESFDDIGKLAPASPVERRKRVMAKSGYLDARERLFLRDKAAHGVSRTVGDDDVKSVQRALNSIYRFGCPLPDALHFDVQPPGDSFFKEPFYCSVDGPQEVTAPYVNVYPNDKVRVPK